jgi:hypothetical protein
MSLWSQNVDDAVESESSQKLQARCKGGVMNAAENLRHRARRLITPLSATFMSTAAVFAFLGAGRQSAVAAPARMSTAPAQLLIANVLTSRVIGSAGLGSAHVEDDGGAESSGSFRSQARTTAADGNTLTVQLASYSNVGSARTSYNELFAGQPGASAIKGAGYTGEVAGDSAFALKGSQVLSIQGQLGAAAQQQLDQEKETGAPLSSSVVASTGKDAAALAAALAPKLTGQATRATNLVSIPKGAMNPCSVPASSLHYGSIQVTSQPTLSDSPPALECIYTFTGTGSGEPGTGMLAVYTLTQTQAQAAVPPTTAKAFLASIPQDTAGGSAQFQTATSGNSEAEGTVSGEPDFLLGLNVDDPDATDPELVVQVHDDESSFDENTDACSDEVHIIERLVTDEEQQEASGKKAEERYAREAAKRLAEEDDKFCDEDAGGG